MIDEAVFALLQQALIWLLVLDIVKYSFCSMYVAKYKFACPKDSKNKTENVFKAISLLPKNSVC